jgi:hypothetical protein
MALPSMKTAARETAAGRLQAGTVATSAPAEARGDDVVEDEPPLTIDPRVEGAAVDECDFEAQPAATTISRVAKRMDVRQRRRPVVGIGRR